MTTTALFWPPIECYASGPFGNARFLALSQGLALSDPFFTTPIKRLICGARILFPFEAGGRLRLARAQAPVVSVHWVLATRCRCVATPAQVVVEVRFVDER
jgi:hypothetical protein